MPSVARHLGGRLPSRIPRPEFSPRSAPRNDTFDEECVPNADGVFPGGAAILPPVLQDCLKRFEDGAIGKMRTPTETCAWAEARLRAIDPPGLAGWSRVERPSGVPQVRVDGTERYRHLTGQGGANGKGHCDEAALASGLVEFAERYSCATRLRRQPVLLASFAERQGEAYALDEVASHVVRPGALAALDYPAARAALTTAPVRWYPARTLQGVTAHLPMPLLQHFLMTSNGIAAGNSFEEAVCHAVCEVVERHCLTLVYHRRLGTPIIDQTNAPHAIVHELVGRFAALGQQVLLRDFSLDLGIPVVAAIRPLGDGRVSFTAGVATSAAEAAVRALTESSQTEGTPQHTLPADAASFLLATDCRRHWSELPSNANPNIRLEVEALDALLHRAGMNLFLLDVSDPELAIPSAVAVIAGAKMWDPRDTGRTLVHSIVHELCATGRFMDAEAVLVASAGAPGEDEAVNLSLRGIVAWRRGENDLAQALLERCLELAAREGRETERPFPHAATLLATLRTGLVSDPAEHPRET
jgi:ribosomal protein S12 methylthiotransferase accessory factor YcaO